MSAIHCLAFEAGWPESSILSLLSNPHTQAWGVSENDRILGFILCNTVMDEAEITTFAIHPDHQDQGLGKQLLEHTLLTVSKTGAHRIFLEVSKDNNRAIQLYVGQSFEKVAERHQYYQTRLGPKDAYVFALQK